MRVQMIMRKILAPMVTFVLLMPVMPQLLGQATSDTTKRSPMYDTATETTVNGTVEAVNVITGRRGWGGTHLQLTTGDGMLDVHVGPAWYLTKQGFAIAKGDQLTVTGSKIQYNNADALLARTIKKGDSEITLRNAQGIPAWSRGRRE